MKNIKTRWLYAFPFALLIWLLIAASASETSCEQKEEGPDVVSEIKKGLDSGKNVVVLFMTKEDSAKFAGEDNSAYDDWSYYFNSFYAEAQGTDTLFVTVSLKEAKSIFEEYDMPESKYSLLFMKKGKKSLYHPGPVLEPYVYKYVKAFFDDHEGETEYYSLVGISPDGMEEVTNKEIPGRLGFTFLVINIQ